MTSLDISKIVDGILKGDTVSISRAISIVENDLYSDRALEILQKIHPHTGRAHIVGITGPPGVGKSSIIGSLLPILSRKGRRAAIVAIDASSPFTRGSIMGNRIRMQENLTRYGTYMRSLSTRGLSGGLSFSALGTAKILDAAGFDTVILETVGAGQSDLDIMRLAATVVVVLAPGLGDEIQAIKAGLMEIAHLFVINKSDREGSFQSIKDIQDILLTAPQGEWKIPVIGTSTITGDGLEELIQKMDDHSMVNRSGKDRNRLARNELNLIVESELMKLASREMEENDGISEIISQVADGSKDPFSGSRSIIFRITRDIHEEP